MECVFDVRLNQSSLAIIFTEVENRHLSQAYDRAHVRLRACVASFWTLRLIFSGADLSRMGSN